ncbi:short chain type dehydrogenase [Vararia minispora EC-137]|uniref:Short chain type dehydrogenase n=1 Tax=Vararia minispora EC-137 TaxID=1314806 RepID=A0ACB8QMR7_9AGAM|nr:short chain type dehydrogenase [Vararia minispora EC-137]
MKVRNRTFVVSGGSSGLGLATVQALLNAQAYVAILDLRPPANLSSSRAKFWKADITSETEVEVAVEGSVAWSNQTGAILGGVINCAGVGTGAKIIGADNEPHPLDLWRFALEVNLTGTFNLSRLVCKHLIHVAPEGPDGERGVVVMVASSAAFEGQPGQAAYSASKGGLVAMTLPLARDLGRHGIRVVSVAPGAFTSPMTDRMSPKTQASVIRELVFPRRPGMPEEFAQTVMWVIGCQYVNGETIRLSGGARLPGKL